MNSTKTIIEKLKLDKYSTRLLLHLPEGMEDFKGLDFDTSIDKEQYELIFIFIFHKEEADKYIQLVKEKKLLKDNGYLFIAYPKKNNPKYKEYIDRDSFYEGLNPDEEGYLPDSSLKFARMVSLNEVFTIVGLKSAPKKAKKSANPKKSQCVDDYIVHIDDVKKFLRKNEAVLKAYNELTYGYQKDWARYVYSAKREETQEKRLHEMETILSEGYKSIDLYRRNKK